jgi:hypothetical protein
VTDDPYPRLMPALAGVLISLASLVLPLSLVATDRVKSPYWGNPPEENGNQEATIKRTLPTEASHSDLRLPSVSIFLRCGQMCVAAPTEHK